MNKSIWTVIPLLAIMVSGCSEKQDTATAAKPSIAPSAIKQAEKKADPHANPHAATPGAKSIDEERLSRIEAEIRADIEANPESAKARAKLAAFLLTQNRTAEAIPAYQDAITLDAENPKLFAALSIAYLHQGKFNMAQAMANEALRLNPDMEQVKKINDYIALKQQVTEQANKADIRKKQELASPPIPNVEDK